MIDLPVLYILMRTDLDSLNPGKAMAQASHASLMLEKRMGFLNESDFMVRNYKEWKAQANGFGTTYVSGGTLTQINKVIQRFARRPEIMTGWVIDPTYPVQDGKIVHQLAVNTCAFVFGIKSECVSFGVEELRLHK